MTAHAAPLLPLLTHGLGLADAAPRGAALRASLAFVGVLENDAARRPFLPLFPLVLAALQRALNENEEADAAEILEALVSLAAEAPVFFRDAMAPLGDAMLAVASAPALEFGTRARAVELLLTLAERAPALVRRHKALVERLVPVVFEMMCAAEDDAAWARGAYVEGIDDDEDFRLGEEALERMMTTLAATALPTALTLASQALGQTGSWSRQRAALAALARIADGNPKAFRPQLAAVVPALVQVLQAAAAADGAGGVAQHPRVAFEALQASCAVARVCGSPTPVQWASHHRLAGPPV